MNENENENENVNMTKLLSMKEFSGFTGIPQTTLRYWDEIGLFSPETRNPDNGYRYYSPLQIIAINFVSVLSTLGISLKSIDLLASERTPEKISEMMDEHENILDMELRRLRDAYSIIHARRDLIRLGLQGDESEISIDTVGDAPIILGPPNNFQEDADFHDVFMEFCDQAKPNRINLNYPIGAYFETMDEFFASPDRPSRFFTIDPTGYEKREAGEYLVGYTRGYYTNMNDLPERMQTYAQKHCVTFRGPVYITYLHDELSVVDPDQYLARVIIGVSQEKSPRQI